MATSNSATSSFHKPIYAIITQREKKALATMTKREKHPGGRPTLYRREYCDQIVDAMATGLSAEAAAARIGISARSLFNWQRQHPEFLQAFRRAARSACCIGKSAVSPLPMASLATCKWSLWRSRTDRVLPMAGITMLSEWSIQDRTVRRLPSRPLPGTRST